MRACSGRAALTSPKRTICCPTFRTDADGIPSISCTLRPSWARMPRRNSCAVPQHINMLTYIVRRPNEHATAHRRPELRMPNAHCVLLDPIRVGSVTLTRRLVMGSMHTGLECQPERFAPLG